MSKEISMSEFISDVKSGMSKELVVSKYNLPKSVVNRFAKESKVKFKRNIMPKYILINDINDIKE